jgi:hypothetical protein
MTKNQYNLMAMSGLKSVLFNRRGFIQRVCDSLPNFSQNTYFFDCGNLVSKVREVLGILQPQPVKIKSS